MIRWFLLIAAVRGVTVILEGDPAAGVLLLAGCAVALLGPIWAVAVGAAAADLLMGGSNSVTLIAWVAAALALFDGRDRILALQAQAVVVYGFAVANKMWPTFASGQVIADHSPWMPWPQAAAGAVLFTEALLCVGVARRWPFVLAVAIPAHIGFTLGVAQGFEHAVALATFNGLMVWLVWASRRRPDLHDSGREVRNRSAGADDDPSGLTPRRNAVRPLVGVGPR